MKTCIFLPGPHCVSISPWVILETMLGILPPWAADSHQLHVPSFQSVLVLITHFRSIVLRTNCMLSDSFDCIQCSSGEFTYYLTTQNMLIYDVISGRIEAGGFALQTRPTSMEDLHDEPPRRSWRGWANAKALAHQHRQGQLPRMSWSGWSQARASVRQGESAN